MGIDPQTLTLLGMGGLALIHLLATFLMSRRQAPGSAAPAAQPAAPQHPFLDVVDEWVMEALKSRLGGGLLALPPAPPVVVNQPAPAAAPRP